MLRMIGFYEKRSDVKDLMKTSFKAALNIRRRLKKEAAEKIMEAITINSAEYIEALISLATRDGVKGNNDKGYKYKWTDAMTKIGSIKQAVASIENDTKKENPKNKLESRKKIKPKISIK